MAQQTKATVIKAEMSEESQEDAVHTAAEALDRFQEVTEIPEFIKKEFDKKYGPSWHCIVGTNFCSYFTHLQECFVYFSLNGRDYLLFKTPAT
ncbi:hypothetical protein P879_01378 [Paragonimus westermani]|uniref:Dynein light chain n=1 Tax=Paragonimus westermani TaxID=34504 RepID=A0A8T0DVC1_9TREM|nr:hypothetical protein P879_01378 [Paragonimus westermani]